MQLPTALSMLLIRIMTHNIRYAATDLDGEEKPWPIRAPRIVSELRFTTYDNPAALISLQEVLHDQLVDILTGLNNASSTTASADEEPNEWASIGVGRDDGEQEGEYSPILYRPAIWDSQNFTTVWLSPTPDVPSFGWDAGSIRILTIGEFVHKASGAHVVAMNTHLDNAGTVSRRHSAEIITAEIERRVGNGTGTGCPALYLTGDFNSEPGQEAYQYMTGAESPVYDEKTVIPESERYGHRTGTFTGFSSNEEVSLLDYIFLQKGERWTPRTYAVLENLFDDGVYLSDHRAVIADVELRL